MCARACVCVWGRTLRGKGRAHTHTSCTSSHGHPDYLDLLKVYFNLSHLHAHWVPRRLTHTGTYWHTKARAHIPPNLMFFGCFETRLNSTVWSSGIISACTHTHKHTHMHGHLYNLGLPPPVFTLLSFLPYLNYITTSSRLASSFHLCFTQM